MAGEATQPSLPEQEDVLAVEGDVGIRGEESGPEESVRTVRRLLPEDVREWDESDAGGGHEGLRRVRPDPELAVDRAEGVSDVDREDSSGHEDPIALGPGVRKDPKHPGIVGGPERAEQPIPLRDHRIRGRSEHEMDRAVGDPAQPPSVPVDEPDGPSGDRTHGGGKPWHD